MKTLWWQTVGTEIVILCCCTDGDWNAEVWRCISEELAHHGTPWWIHCYGRSHGWRRDDADDMAEQVWKRRRKSRLARLEPGNMALQIALRHPERVQR